MQRQKTRRHARTHTHTHHCQIAVVIVVVFAVGELQKLKVNSRQLCWHAKCPEAPTYDSPGYRTVSGNRPSQEAGCSPLPPFLSLSSFPSPSPSSSLPFPPSSHPFRLLSSPLLHSLYQAGNAWVFELFAQLTFNPKHCWLRGHAYNLPINLYSNSNLKFEPRFDTIFGLNFSAIISFVFTVNLIFGNRSEFVLLLPRPHWRSAPTYCVGVRYYVCVCVCVFLLRFLSRCNLSFWRGKFCCSFAAFLCLYSVHSYVCHSPPPLHYSSPLSSRLWLKCFIIYAF